MSSPKRLAICGYGRFGAALAELALGRGYRVTAYDPTAAIPAELRASSLEELCAGNENLLLAVPLEHFEASLRALQPHLRSEHLVLDVGSVKLEPVRAMQELLGDDVDWLGTHPLFGPTSLARGDRPLRVVLTEGSAAGPSRARALWQDLGCECIEQSAETHDRAMARSHALAFFLAKGLLQIKAGEGAAFTPPSFEAIGKTITAVRSDAGHLFRAIQNRNPFAAEERDRLIDALRDIHAELKLPAGTSSPLSAQIPRLEEPDAKEPEAGALLAELDQELVALLARRMLLAGRLSPMDRSLQVEALAKAATRIGFAPDQAAILSTLLEKSS